MPEPEPIAVEAAATQATLSEITAMIAKYGIGGVIALFSVWQLWQNVPALRAELHDHVVTTGFYLRQICMNTATSDMQRAVCEREQGH